MANSIASANMDSSRFTSALSRYRNSTVVYYAIGTAQYLTFTTYKKQVSPTPSQNDKYALITPGMEYRPDAVSKSVYGTTDLWWKILEANNMKDIFEFKAGITIRLPGSIF